MEVIVQAIGAKGWSPESLRTRESEAQLLRCVSFRLRNVQRKRLLGAIHTKVAVSEK